MGPCPPHPAASPALASQVRLDAAEKARLRDQLRKRDVALAAAEADAVVRQAEVDRLERALQVKALEMARAGQGEWRRVQAWVWGWWGRGVGGAG